MEWGHSAPPPTDVVESGPLALPVHFVEKDGGSSGHVQGIDGSLHGDGDGVIAGSQDVRRQPVAFAAENDATIAGEIRLGEDVIRRARMGCEAPHAPVPQNLQGLLEAARFDDGQLEDRAHGVPDGASEERAAGSFAYDEGLNAEGDAIANEGSEVFGIRQSIDCGEEPRRRAAGKDGIEGSRLGNFADGQHALEHREADELFQNLLFLDDVDREIRFRSSLKKRFIIGEPFVGKQNGDDFKPAFQKAPNDFLAFGDEDALLLVIERPSQSAVRRQFREVEMIDDLDAKHGELEGIAPSMP